MSSIGAGGGYTFEKSGGPENTADIRVAGVTRLYDQKFLPPTPHRHFFVCSHRAAGGGQRGGHKIWGTPLAEELRGQTQYQLINTDYENENEI